MSKSLLKQLEESLEWLDNALDKGEVAFRPDPRKKEVDLLARTMWGEARNQGIEGMQAVANVILNRVNHKQGEGRKWMGWPDTIEGVVKQPNQFSMWNFGDENRIPAKEVTEENKQFRQAKKLAKQAVYENLPDITGNAYWYHADYVDPDWNDNLNRTKKIGDHIFYTA